MGVGKQRAPRGKPVEVGSLYLRVPAQTADPIIQVIDGDEEDIGFFLSISEGCRHQEYQ